MLRQELQEDQPAAQVRVSAQELAEAVSAVEQRKGLTGQTVDSISLGEAVDQLGLSVSAEELLAEIKSKQIHQAKLASERRIKLRKRVFIALVAVLAVSLFSNVYFLSQWSPAPTSVSGIEYSQNGSFRTVKGQEGDITFPQPYGRAPNVELNSFSNTIVTQTRPDGFHWRNPGGSTFDDVDVQWSARGVR